MSKGVYLWTRDLHLYLGLFVSPYLLTFAFSVFFVNHAQPPVDEVTTATIQDLIVPPGVRSSQVNERLESAREVLSQVGVTGEINFIRFVAKENRLVIPVVKPGIETTVDLRVDSRTATITSRATGLGERLVYLHRSPGPHNVGIRGNWLWTRVWRWLADATVYLTLFLSLSGIYMWTVLRSERKVGLILLLAGTLSFFGAVYAVIA